MCVQLHFIRNLIHYFVYLEYLFSVLDRRQLKTVNFLRIGELRSRAKKNDCRKPKRMNGTVRISYAYTEHNIEDAVCLLSLEEPPKNTDRSNFSRD